MELCGLCYPNWFGPPEKSSDSEPMIDSIARLWLARRRKELNVVKQERWTEADLDELPAEEPDVFDRKAGQHFETGQVDFGQNGSCLRSLGLEPLLPGSYARIAE